MQWRVELSFPINVSPVGVDLRAMAGRVMLKSVRSELHPRNGVRYDSQSGRNRLKGDGGSRSVKVSPVGAASKEWQVSPVGAASKEWQIRESQSGRSCIESKVEFLI